MYSAGHCDPPYLEVGQRAGCNTECGEYDVIIAISVALQVSNIVNKRKKISKRCSDGRCKQSKQTRQGLYKVATTAPCATNKVEYHRPT